MIPKQEQREVNKRVHNLSIKGRKVWRGLRTHKRRPRSQNLCANARVGEVSGKNFGCKKLALEGSFFCAKCKDTRVLGVSK